MINLIAARNSLLAALIQTISCGSFSDAPEKFTKQTASIRWENLRVSSSEFMTLEDSVAIFSNKSYNIVRLNTRETHILTIIDKEGNILDETEDSVTKYKYFIYKLSEDRGYLYDSINPSILTKNLSVDTILMKFAYKSSSYENEIAKGKLIESQIKDGVLKEIYLTAEDNVNDIDTLVYFYDKRLIDLTYSFSHNLDSLKLSKLFKVIYVVNQNGIPQSADYTPKSEHQFMLKRNNEDIDVELNRLIKTHERNLESLR